jgi:hypothetical protein
VEQPLNLRLRRDLSKRLWNEKSKVSRKEAFFKEKFMKTPRAAQNALDLHFALHFRDQPSLCAEDESFSDQRRRRGSHISAYSQSLKA